MNGESSKMRTWPTVVAVLLVAAVVAASCGGSDQSAAIIAPSAGVDRAAVDLDAPVDQLVDGINAAGFDLFLTQPASDNVVMSPTSIGRTLLMARAAADELTGAAIDTTFGLPLGLSAHEAWNSLDSTLIASNGTAEAADGSATPIVQVAARIWPALTVKPDQSWIDLLATQHGADVVAIDTSKPEESRGAINQWVSEETNELIPELLPPGFITGNTVLVLSDAVYLKAQWQNIFGKYGPLEDQFTLLDGSTVPVSLMVDLEQLGPRGQGEDFVFAQVPYLGDDYEMLVVVPNNGSFAAVRDRLSGSLLDEVLEASSTGPYELRIPEWETTTGFDFLPWLIDVGIAPGRFPGIAEGAFIDGAVHGADIAVDELGIEAAAATALGFEEEGPPEPELLVAADHPFLYLVRHVDTSLVLFVGQVTDPS